jgi:hypothetical protein
MGLNWYVQQQPWQLEQNKLLKPLAILAFKKADC